MLGRGSQASIIKTIGCLFYILTLRAPSALVVNALLLWLVSVVAGWLSLPFHITGFVPAFLGASWSRGDMAAERADPGRKEGRRPVIGPA